MIKYFKIIQNVSKQKVSYFYLKNEGNLTTCVFNGIPHTFNTNVIELPASKKKKAVLCWLCFGRFKVESFYRKISQSQFEATLKK